MGGAQVTPELNNATVRYPQLDGGVCVMFLGLGLFWAWVGVAVWVIV
jgi:hypothetical protein